MTQQFQCRSCGAVDYVPILDLGRQPLANALRTAEELKRPEPTYPLELVFCPVCSLVQLRESVPPQLLFDDYCYFSSVSDTMLRHARALALRMIYERRLGPDSLVLEAASNDGYLLRNYHESGVPVLGIEPARNVAAVARQRHAIPTREAYFSRALADRLVRQGLRCDVFHAHNVLAHVPDLAGFLAGVRAVLKNDGVAILEVPYVRDLIERCEFDTIYHEHLCYFSLTSLCHCLTRHALVAVDVERIAIHGGSLRLVVARTGSATQGVRVTSLLAEEEGWGIKQTELYEDFAGRVEQLKNSLCNLLRELKIQGHRIAAYGASAKGSTLLNYCGIGRETLDYIVDRSPAKQGKYAPGSALPIHPPEKLHEDQPDYTLLLTWNFAEEIRGQQAAYLANGGRFITPIPEPMDIKEPLAA